MHSEAAETRAQWLHNESLKEEIAFELDLDGHGECGHAKK